MHTSSGKPEMTYGLLKKPIWKPSMPTPTTPFTQLTMHISYGTQVEKTLVTLSTDDAEVNVLVAAGIKTEKEKRGRKGE